MNRNEQKRVLKWVNFLKRPSSWYDVFLSILSWCSQIILQFFENPLLLDVWKLLHKWIIWSNFQTSKSNGFSKNCKSIWLHQLRIDKKRSYQEGERFKKNWPTLICMFIGYQRVHDYSIIQNIIRLLKLLIHSLWLPSDVWDQNQSILCCPLLTEYQQLHEWVKV